MSPEGAEFFNKELQEYYKYGRGGRMYRWCPMFQDWMPSNHPEKDLKRLDANVKAT